MVDAALTAMWFSTLADSLGGRDTLSVVMMVARLGVAAVAAVAGWNIAQQRPQGAVLGTIALTLMVVFAFVTAWSGVLPTNLDPAWRVPAALVTTGAALTAVLVLHR
jgi:hypothetical protein